MDPRRGRLDARCFAFFGGQFTGESQLIPMRMASVSSLRYLRRNRYEYLLLCASQLAVWACDCALSMCCTMHRFLAIGLFIACYTKESCMYVAYGGIASITSHRILTGWVSHPAALIGFCQCQGPVEPSEPTPVCDCIMHPGDNSTNQSCQVSERTGEGSWPINAWW